MSAYHQYETQFEDSKCLVEALHDVSGYNAAVYDKAIKLHDYHGGLRADTAEIVVPRAQIPGPANDVGFKMYGSAYKAIISEYDRCRHNDEWMNKVKQAYSEHKSITVAEKQGYSLASREVTKDEQGRPKTNLRFERQQVRA